MLMVCMKKNETVEWKIARRACAHLWVSEFLEKGKQWCAKCIIVLLTGLLRLKTLC